MLKKIENFFLDTLFPINCLFCGQAKSWLCEACSQKIILRSFQVCPVCEKNITVQGKICHSCQQYHPALDFLLVATNYQEGHLAHLIHLYKYNFVIDLSLPLGKILLKSLLQSDFPLPDAIIPVPLHPRRLRWRGFNQAELLANYLSENITPGFPIPVSKNNLIRKKYTSSQMKIKNYYERKKNLKDAFRLKNPAEIKNKNLWLIDDIATTGSTLFECAKVLKEAGAKKVYALVLARQEIKN